MSPRSAQLNTIGGRRPGQCAIVDGPELGSSGLDSEALEFRAASESFAPVRALSRRDLETLRLLTRHEGRPVPTVGGMLLFGKDRERDFPDAWIQAGRFAGRDKSRIVDQVEIHALPVRAVEEAIAFRTRHSVHGAEIGPVRRVERWSIPPAAAREAVINAVVHSKYAQRGAPIRISVFDDRVEVENPGLLPFGLTIEGLPQGVSKLQNRVIGRVFHALAVRSSDRRPRVWEPLRGAPGPDPRRPHQSGGRVR